MELAAFSFDLIVRRDDDTAYIDFAHFSLRLSCLPMLESGCAARSVNSVLTSVLHLRLGHLGRMTPHDCVLSRRNGTHNCLFFFSSIAQVSSRFAEAADDSL